MTPRHTKASAAARARYARYRQTEGYRQAQLRYRTSEKWKRVQSVYSKKDMAANPLRVGARRAVAIAVTFGALQRPNRCSRCGSDGRIEAHHYLGWELVHWFDILWFCSRCHKAEHWGPIV